MVPGTPGSLAPAFVRTRILAANSNVSAAIVDALERQIGHHLGNIEERHQQHQHGSERSSKHSALRPSRQDPDRSNNQRESRAVPPTRSRLTSTLGSSSEEGLRERGEGTRNGPVRTRQTRRHKLIRRGVDRRRGPAETASAQAAHPNTKSRPVTARRTRRPGATAMVVCRALGR